MGIWQGKIAEQADDRNDDPVFLRARIAELEELVARDPLTGLFNRRHFDHLLAQAIARAERYKTGQALLFLDIDRMKTVNDQLGHLTGDSMLKQLATMIERNIRLSDAAARIGGDEFAILLEAIDEPSLDRKCDMLADQIATITLGEGDGAIHCSCSIGRTLLQPGDTAESAIARADADMYVRKAARAA